jgi:hypothetical protein
MLNTDTRGEVSDQLYAPAALLPGKTPTYLMDRRIKVPNQVSKYGRREKSLPILDVEPGSSSL